MAKRTNLEKETILLFNEADPTAEITAYSARLKRRLCQLAQDRPDECRLVLDSSDGSADYVVPKSWIKINPPRYSAPLTEEQKEKRRAMLSAARNAYS